MKTLKYVVYSLLICTILTPILTAQKTQNITITDNTNPAGTKYYCYHRLYGSTYTSADRKDLGTAKTYSWILNPPIALGTHYWVCRAYVLEGTNLIEAVDSNEISWVNAPAAITITGTVAAIGKKDVILQAQSTAPIYNVKVTYGPMNSPATYVKTVSIPADVSFSTQLSGLKNHTTYRYTWSGMDVTSGQTYTFNGTFTTL